MRIFGIDFTSAPRAAKPMTCAVCQLDGDRLAVEDVALWTSFEDFESFLLRPGPWTAAVDFPLGQPRRLVQALHWPESWDEYVELVGQMTKAEFVELIDQYRQRQPPGDKHHLRTTDKLAGSCSPMMLYGVPVGKMFFEGAPRLQRAGVSVLPCRPNQSGRKVVEGYPALVAKRLINGHSYKSERSESSSRREARRRIVDGCQSSAIREAYGIALQLSADMQQLLVGDPKGDSLDAVLCAVQATAVELANDQQASIPATADSAEGWIADPTYGH